MSGRIIAAVRLPTAGQPPDLPSVCCPVCGDPYIGGPGCYLNQCAHDEGEPEMTMPYQQYATELFANLDGEEVNSDAVQELLEAKGVDYDHTDVAEIEALVEQMAEQNPAPDPR